MDALSFDEGLEAESEILRRLSFSTIEGEENNDQVHTITAMLPQFQKGTITIARVCRTQVAIIAARTCPSLVSARVRKVVQANSQKNTGAS